jgi:ferritin-like metal-binding protein YciE
MEQEAMESLEKLFEETLKDVYFAEKQIIKSLPKMAKKTSSPQLKQAFEEHLEQTKGQVERLDEVFKLLGKKASGKECPALMGLVEEAEELMDEAKDPEVLDAGLIGCAQAVEHYEIARYGTLRTWAEQLGMREAAQLLQATLDEEKTTDKKLSQLATGGMNKAAMNSDEDDDGDDEHKSPMARKSAAASTSLSASRSGSSAKSAARKK